MRHDDMICYLPLFINLNISLLGGNPLPPTFDIKTRYTKAETNRQIKEKQTILIIKIMPLIAITGTPGTGKTSVCRALGSEYSIINLNTVIKRRGFYTGIDADRGCLIADLRRLAEYIRREVENSEKPVVIESHLAHLLPLQPDVAIVLRTNPAVLASRLRQKGFPMRKIEENVEAEMLDVILIEAVELCHVIYELDTTNSAVSETASIIREIIDVEVQAGVRGERGADVTPPRKESLRLRFRPGSINWLKDTVNFSRVTSA